MTADTETPSAVVLVAEDDVVILDLMERALEKQPGVIVAVARDGMQAWRGMRALRPDLLVLDRKLPGVDITYLLRQLKMQPATSLIPVIGIADTPQAESEVLAAGCVATFAKPFDADAFAMMVQLHLSQRAPSMVTARL